MIFVAPKKRLDSKLGKKFCNSLKIGPNYFLHHFKNKIIFNFVKYLATKNGMTKNIFHSSLLLLLLDAGSGIRYPERIKIRIRDKHPDPLHWAPVSKLCVENLTLGDV
jgi:hypothetical protein